jgi:hypothetical protein
MAAGKVLTSDGAKKLLRERNIKMPWEKGFDANLAARTPNAKEEAEAITKRENEELEKAQVSKLKKSVAKAEELEVVK